MLAPHAKAYGVLLLILSSPLVCALLKELSIPLANALAAPNSNAMSVRFFIIILKKRAKVLKNPRITKFFCSFQKKILTLHPLSAFWPLCGKNKSRSLIPTRALSFTYKSALVQIVQPLRGPRIVNLAARVRSLYIRVPIE